MYCLVHLYYYSYLVVGMPAIMPRKAALLVDEHTTAAILLVG